MSDSIDLIGDFRDVRTMHALGAAIREASATLTRPLRVMEVCGGHTNSIVRYGLKDIVGDGIDFVHGPGCPVCVMPAERIEAACTLARQRDVILVTLGDMIAVKGASDSLSDLRAKGADVRAIYSPLEVLKIARENKTKQVIYFAIGFETTTPMSASLMKACIKEGLDNVLFHSNHVLIIPPLVTLLDDPHNTIDALLAPSHVSAITGSELYAPLMKYNKNIVIAGFEPVDILQSVLLILQNKDTPRLANEYSRVVSKEGNLRAKELIDTYLTVREDFSWRGLGNIKYSSLKIRDEFAMLDAEVAYASELGSIERIDELAPCKGAAPCLCSRILKGYAKPKDCANFGTLCTPRTPLGSCMVSGEGACHAYYKYE